MLNQAVIAIFNYHRCSFAGLEGKITDGDSARSFDLQNVGENRNSHFDFLDRRRRPEIEISRAVVVVPFSFGVEFFEGILEVIPVVRMQIVTAGLFQRQFGGLWVKGSDGFDKVPPSILRKNIDFDIFGMRPGSNVFRKTFDPGRIPKMSKSIFLRNMDGGTLSNPSLPLTQRPPN